MKACRTLATQRAGKGPSVPTTSQLARRPVRSSGTVISLAHAKGSGTPGIEAYLNTDFDHFLNMRQLDETSLNASFERSHLLSAFINYLRQKAPTSDYQEVAESGWDMALRVLEQIFPLAGSCEQLESFAWSLRCIFNRYAAGRSGICDCYVLDQGLITIQALEEAVLITASDPAHLHHIMIEFVQTESGLRSLPNPSIIIDGLPVSGQAL